MAAASGEVVLIVTSVIFLLIQNQIVPCEGGEYILQKVEIPDKDLRIFTNEDLKKYDDSDVSMFVTRERVSPPSKLKVSKSKQMPR